MEEIVRRRKGRVGMQGRRCRKMETREAERRKEKTGDQVLGCGRRRKKKREEGRPRAKA